MVELKVGKVVFNGHPFVPAIPRPVTARPQDSADRLREIVRRQDEAIDIAIDALARLSKTGSLKRDIRERAIESLTLARNERLRDVET